MKQYQREFIEFSLKSGVLKFGEFKLKSGRLSPYFFNAGMFNDGNAFYELSSFYADVIYETFLEKFDVLFGPAYKGISLATAASIGLKIKYNCNLPVSFNRKEIKDHGEGGSLIGAPLEGRRALLIDDVITAGTTIRESLEIINKAKGSLIGIVIALDRQERGITSKLSAIQEVEKELNIPVASIISLDNIITYLQEQNAKDQLGKVFEYRKLYGDVTF